MAEENKPQIKPTAPARKPDAAPNRLTGDSSGVFVTDQADVSSVPPVAGEVPDPRTASDDFVEGDQAGFAGTHGFDADGSVPVGAVGFVDPKNIPADVTTGVQPDSGGDKLLAAAQAKAPNLTRAFVQAYGLTDQDLGAIARGEVSPPPAIGPAHTSDLWLTPGGWVSAPPGITPADLEASQAARRR
jgi:hypothetical protein